MSSSPKNLEQQCQLWYSTPGTMSSSRSLSSARLSEPRASSSRTVLDRQASKISRCLLQAHAMASPIARHAPSADCSGGPRELTWSVPNIYGLPQHAPVSISLPLEETNIYNTLLLWHLTLLQRYQCPLMAAERNHSYTEFRGKPKCK